MARPTKTKDPKPRSEGGSDSSSNALGGFTGILINAGLTIVIAAVFVIANYLIIDNMLKTSLKPANDPLESHSEEEGHEVASTFPYDLDDFIINLNSPNEKRYLKVKVSLEVERHEGEPEIGKVSHAGGGGGGTSGKGHGGAGNGGASGPAPVNPKEVYNSIMEPFKMPIRDVIITVLSSKSAEELASTAGKEQAKSEIKEQVNTIMPEDRQVKRVNFGDFIIQ